MPPILDTPITPEMEGSAKQVLSDLYAGKEPEISSDIEDILVQLLRSTQNSSDTKSLLLTREGQRLFRRFANEFPSEARVQIKSIIKDDGSFT
jgi:hypothetical protein